MLRPEEPLHPRASREVLGPLPLQAQGPFRGEGSSRYP